MQNSVPTKRWVRYFHQTGLPLGEDGRRVTGSKEHVEFSRRSAAEGMVLLKNDNEVLPLSKGSRIALFGKGTIDYVRGGGGSGEVIVEYYRNLYEGLQIKEEEGKVQLYHALPKFYEEYVSDQYSMGIDAGMVEEPEIPSDLLEEAASFTDTAIITLSRFSGEGWDRKPPKEAPEYLWEGEKRLSERLLKVFPKGDYYLTSGEKAMIETVKSRFSRVIVVVNAGSVIESGWIKNDEKISSALYMWAAGMEGGLAAADLIVGDDTPSAKLADTFAETLDDYPSGYNFHESNNYAEYTDDIYVGYRYFETVPGAAAKVVYPFGYGLSYTTFDVYETDAAIDDNCISVKVRVTNTGKYSGKEVVMLYYSAPQGVLGKPSKELGVFAKTNLLKPGESQEVELLFELDNMASFDDLGKIQKSAWVSEKGVYSFYIGSNVRELQKVSLTFEQEDDYVVKQLTALLTPNLLKERMLPDGSMEKLPLGEEKKDPSVFPRMANLDIEATSPVERGCEIRKMGYRKDIILSEVASGEHTLEEFMAQLSDDELIHLIGGQKNVGIANTLGVGDLPEYGVPNIATADGPAGLRIVPEIGIYTTAWPSATMIACSFNTELSETIGQYAAMELKENNLGIWLAPAVNIHRTPLCGRNFEYYSEDPVVAGLIGSAMVKGIQSQKIAATVKHFAFNNKETNRKHSDSRVSERAAREIYLKVFEIIVREAEPWCIMSAYNKINGTHCSENGELINGILRGEWGYKGLVMSDWWTSGEQYLEAKAGNDLKMPLGYPDRLREAYKMGEISREEIYVAARNVLKLILKMD